MSDDLSNFSPLNQYRGDMKPRETLIVLAGSIVPGLSSENRMYGAVSPYWACPLGPDLSHRSVPPGTSGGSSGFYLRLDPS